MCCSHDDEDSDGDEDNYHDHRYVNDVMMTALSLVVVVMMMMVTMLQPVVAIVAVLLHLLIPFNGLSLLSMVLLSLVLVWWLQHCHYCCRLSSIGCCRSCHVL